MIEILGASIGFIGSFVPNIFKFIQDKSDKKHELLVLEMQIKAQKSGHINKLEEINLQGDVAESKALYNTFYSGNKTFDSLNASVRPILAYAFFLLYVATKITYIFNVEEFYFEQLWSSIDNTIFLTIISFFYGQRAMQKILRD